MLTNQGRLRMLANDIVYLRELEWGLFVTEVDVNADTVWADLVEASWSGYARFQVYDWFPPYLYGTVARTAAVNNQYVNNSEAIPVTWWGWFALDTLENTLVGGTQLPEQTIPAGNAALLVPRAAIY